MSTFKCENSECGNVFKSNNPLCCPKCDTLEFSTIHIKFNKHLLVFGFLILLIGSGLFFHLNDESSNTESKETILKPVLELSKSQIETISFNGGLMYSTTNLNVRIKANKNSEKVTSLKLNTPVLTNRKDIGGWILIADTDSNQLGYVHSNYLSEKITPKAIIKLKVGQKLHGGIIFYIDKSGKHGLMAAIKDLGSYEWGCNHIDIQVAYDYRDGNQNTLDIIQQECKTVNGNKSAAQVCSTYNSNRKWYLPSRNELHLMYTNIGTGSLIGNIGRFDIDDDIYYWSSTQNFNYGSWSMSFKSGVFEADMKRDVICKVRPIRNF